jgi:flagella basal body P-ring formation protein FlgA
VHWVLALLMPIGCMAGTVTDASLDLREGQVQIALRADIATADPQVSLGDVAILHSRDLPTLRRLVSLRLGSAPAVGAQAVVSRAAIARWIRSQLAIRDEQVQWSGSEETHVRRLAQELPGARLQREAETALREWLGRRTTRYEVQALTVVADLKLPAGALALQVRPFAQNAQPAQRMLVWVDVQVDGRFVRATPVSFQVDAYQEAWVAPAGVARGVALAPAMVERREVKITGRPAGEALPASRSEPGEIVSGWRTTKTVADGEPITVRNAAPAPLVARGEWVLLHLRSGLVELEGRAQAMQDAGLGQIVQVRSSGGSAPMMARVIAAGRVEAAL